LAFRALGAAFRALGAAFRVFGADFRAFGAAFRGLAFGFAALRALDAVRTRRAFGLGRALAAARLTLAPRRPLLVCFCFAPFFALAAINATRKPPVG
jgi:hypothetical protein